MFSVDTGSAGDNAQNTHYADVKPERKYFTRATPMGASVSELESRTQDVHADAALPKPREAAIKPAKKSRLSFLRKSSNTVTAH